MTQELVLIVLLSGLAGLLWVMRLAMAEEKQSSAKSQSEPDSSIRKDDVQHRERALKHHVIAA
jgi:hypothetical protein